jgi:hypothetical protein
MFVIGKLLLPIIIFVGKAGHSMCIFVAPSLNVFG